MNDNDVPNKSLFWLFGRMVVSDGTLVQVCHHSTVVMASCVKEVESQLYSVSSMKWNVGGVSSRSVDGDPDEPINVDDLLDLQLEFKLVLHQR